MGRGWFIGWRIAGRDHEARPWERTEVGEFFRGHATLEACGPLASVPRSHRTLSSAECVHTRNRRPTNKFRGHCP